jgi:hypothetical protein
MEQLKMSTSYITLHSASVSEPGKWYRASTGSARHPLPLCYPANHLYEGGERVRP